MPIWFETRGFDDTQIGYLLSAAALSVLFTPVILTGLADAHIPPRRLISVVYLAAGMATAAMLSTDSFSAILIIFTIQGLSIAPILPLQDGLFFAKTQAMEDAGEKTPPYHHVRVWGTLGFIAGTGTLALLWQLLRSENMDFMIYVAVAGCSVGLVNSFFLPRAPKAISDASKKLPTLQALASLKDRRLICYCIGMWLVHLACAAYYGFHPLYLTRIVGVNEKTVGLIVNIGVGLETFYMLGFGWLILRLGLRGLVLLGVAGMVIRFSLMASFPNLPVAVLAQAFHGLMALVVHVAPPVYLNNHADSSYRSSMQGVFAMLVVGTGRVTGNYLAGQFAQEWGIINLLYYAAGLSFLGCILMLFAFDRRDRPLNI